MSWRESQNRLAEFGLHGNTYLLPLARFNNAMGGDDGAVRNGDDDGESGTDLELFATLRLPEQNSKAVQRQPS